MKIKHFKIGQKVQCMVRFGTIIDIRQKRGYTEALQISFIDSKTEWIYNPNNITDVISEEEFNKIQSKKK